MSDSNSLLNIGDLAKPVTTLIEKIADFTGAAFLPLQIKRVAEAEAEAEKNKALARLEITEIERRAMARILSEETRNQENIENIVAKSLPELKEDAKPEEISDDWLANFFSKSKNFSGTIMQNIWSKILAGEANEKGSFSKQTIEVVSRLEKYDAEIFTNLQSFVWHIDDPVPFIYEYNNPIYINEKITFNNLNHMESIGLIKFDALSGFRRYGDFRQGLIRYFDSEIHIKFPNTAENEFKLGKVLFTRAGLELASICKGQKSDEFLTFVADKWRNLGYAFSPPLPYSEPLQTSQYLFSGCK